MLIIFQDGKFITPHPVTLADVSGQPMHPFEEVFYRLSGLTNSTGQIQACQ